MRRCTICRRSGHMASAHRGVEPEVLAALKQDGLDFMGRGFRELGEARAGGDLLDLAQAQAERAAGGDRVVESDLVAAVTGGGPLIGDFDEYAAERQWEDEDAVNEQAMDDENDPEFEPVGGPIETVNLPDLPDEPPVWVADDLGPDVVDQLGEQGPLIVPWRTWRGPDEPIRITRPGVYVLDATEYHNPAITGDWLSNSDARQLTGKGCPAQFRYDRDNGVKETSDAFAMGHAVHARILGKGETIAVRPAEFDSWRTKAAQQWRREQEAAGRSVIVPEQADVVEAMAVAVHSKPDAHRLLSQPGRPEMCLFWVDPETGVQRRCMVDYLPSVVDAYGVMEPVDIKSADEVAPNEDMERKLYNHAWHRQGTTIADGIIALGLATDVEFSFIVQSKTAPHLVTVVKLDAEAERIGRIENREAIAVYRECLLTDEWPDFTPKGPVTMTVPVWVARLYEEDIR